MNWFKIGVAAVGAAAAAAAILSAKNRRKQEDADMDEYLMGSDPEQDLIALDAADWKALDEESLPVTITFAISDKDAGTVLQDMLAADGISSSLDADEGIVQVLFTGEEPVETLVEGSKLDGVEYTGYAITE